MASCTVNLHILKGPKEGEILTRKPGTQIRIGRVVKGNNLTIKDPAISQKHILIQFDPEISKWILYDLNTSDGTIINDVKIESLVQIPLSDGDVIKIGEATLISVELEVDGEFENDNSRRGRSKALNNSKGLKKDENLENENEKMYPRRAGLRPRGGIKLSEKLVSVVEDSKVLQKNVKRGWPKKVHSQPMVSSEIKEEKEWSSERIEEQDIQSAVEDRNKMESITKDNVKEKENVEKVENAKQNENAKQKENHEKYNVEEEIDFENMTLGEWFDSLEKYLPLVINEAAEARIAELREQARQFEEYTENGLEGLI